MKRILVFLPVFMVALPVSAQVPPPPPPRMISVSGEASEQIAPDQAILSITLQHKDKSLDKAKSDNDKQADKLVAIAKEFKIAKEKIALSGLNISPEYVYPANGKRQFDGYQVSRSLRITIDELSIHERLLSAIVDSGVDQVGGIQFTLARPEERGNALRVKAFEDARAKADALAKAAGAKLGKALQISTSGGMSQPPAPMMNMRMMAASDGVAEKSVAPSLPGMLTLEQSVSVTFELE